MAGTPEQVLFFLGDKEVFTLAANDPKATWFLKHGTPLTPQKALPIQQKNVARWKKALLGRLLSEGQEFEFRKELAWAEAILSQIEIAVAELAYEQDTGFRRPRGERTTALLRPRQSTTPTTEFSQPAKRRWRSIDD
jgi:hypothetical protein